MSDSPYDEHADERQPCTECGGTHWIGEGFVETCPLCGPPSPAHPDPVAQAALFRRTAEACRKSLRWLVQPKDRQQAIADAEMWERRADALDKARRVA